MTKIAASGVPAQKPSIYIAELTYDTTVISLENFPIAIGYVAAYAQKCLPGSFDFSLFKFPGQLFDAIDASPPDILALSFFPWNRNLGLKVASYYKNIRPEGLVVFGGGNFPAGAARQKEFFIEHPEVDIFVTLDGEYGFNEVLKRYLQNGGERSRMLSGAAIDGCSFLDRSADQLKAGKNFPRPADIDEIPSPYLTGLMDPFFENQLLTPMIQGTRGCPFTCAYCWAGNGHNTKIRHFSLERVFAELDYIAQRRHGKTNQLLTFSDSNFGMYETDEKIAEKIASLQDQYNFPSSFYAPCGKNNKDRVYRIIQKIRNAAAIVSVQSTDAQILTNVARQPIKIEEYKGIVSRFHELGIPVETEIITGLPGETRQTHLKTIKDLIYMGMDEIHPFTLMFLEGTELNTTDSQNKHKWQKRYRVLPRNFGKYRGLISFEVEAVGVGSATFSFEDYLYVRGFHGALRVVFNHAFFSEFTAYLKENGVDIFSFCLAFYEDVMRDPGTVGQQFREFLKEAREELWESEAELVEYFSKEENYARLLTGEKGENLLGKYKVITVSEHFGAWCDFFYAECLKAIPGSGTNSDVREQLEDIRNYVKAKADGILTQDNMHQVPVEIELRYDISRWKHENYAGPLGNFRYKNSRRAAFKIRKENARIVEEILSLYSAEKSSLWKAAGSRYYLPSLFREPCE